MNSEKQKHIEASRAIFENSSPQVQMNFVGVNANFHQKERSQIFCGIAQFSRNNNLKRFCALEVAEPQRPGERA
jgi:hypothetical protein